MNDESNLPLILGTLVGVGLLGALTYLAMTSTEAPNTASPPGPPARTTFFNSLARLDFSGLAPHASSYAFEPPPGMMPAVEDYPSGTGLHSW